MNRLPFVPLEAVVLSGVGTVLGGNGQPLSPSYLVAEALGVHREQVYRWRKIGVTADQADRLAVQVGRHPAEVWPSHLRWRRCEWCRVFIAQDRATRGPRRRTCSKRCRDALSRSRHLTERRAADLARYQARRSPEFLAARAEAARQARRRSVAA